jgi:hypothetical protein
MLIARNIIRLSLHSQLLTWDFLYDLLIFTNFSKCLVSRNCEAGTLLRPGHIAGSNTEEVPALMELIF